MPELWETTGALETAAATPASSTVEEELTTGALLETAAATPASFGPVVTGSLITMAAGVPRGASNPVHSTLT